MPLFAALGAILVGIGTVFGKIWDIFKVIIDWFIRLMPGPLKFFFFLYFLLFLASLFMPVLLGINFDCDSKGNVYKINAIENFYSNVYVDRAVDLCKEAVENEGKISVFSWVKYFFTDYVVSTPFRDIFGIPAVLDLVPAVTGGNVTTSDICYEFSQFNKGNFSNFNSRDFTLSLVGEKLEQKDYKQVVHVGCSKRKNGTYGQTLQFFSLDILNFELWLMIGIFSALVFVAHKWYGMIMR